MPLSSALRFLWCVVWSHGTCGIQTCLRVSADYIYGLNSGVFLSTLLHMPYPNRGVVPRSIQSVFTRLFTPLIAYFSVPQDMCICMFCQPIPDVWTVLPPPRGCESTTKAP